MKKTAKIFSIFLVILMMLVSTQIVFVTSATETQQIYYDISNGEAFVACQPTWVTGDVVISSSYEGYPVTRFSDSDDVMAYIFCEGVTSITLPNTIDVDRLTGFPFCNCPTADIIISADNTELCAEGNVLYNKDKTKLIRYQNNPDSTSFTLPDSVVEVSEMAFTNSNLEELTITNKTIKFNGELNNSFGGHNIKDIYYCGTENEWQSNIIGENNYIFDGITIHFEEDSSTDDSDTPSSDDTETPSEPEEESKFMEFLKNIYEKAIILFDHLVLGLVAKVFDLLLSLIH